MTPVHRSPARPPRQRGLTLIEVLVALLVLSIGLLGLAGLQNVSLQYNHDSYLRTNANNLAYDVMDRMRANRNDALQGRYDLDWGQEPSGGGVPEEDLDPWLTALRTTLPDGEARIQTQRVDGGVVATIDIRWLERGEQEGLPGGDEDADERTTFTLRSKL